VVVCLYSIYAQLLKRVHNCRIDETRVREREEMLRRQEEERKRIPMAPMIDMSFGFSSGDGYLDLEGDEFESIVIDTGMATVKVKEQFKITIHFVCTISLVRHFYKRQM